jgi:hypothetical protein
MLSYSKSFTNEGKQRYYVSEGSGAPVHKTIDNFLVTVGDPTQTPQI